MEKVVYYKFGPYLPITETWIYGQIKNLKRYKPIVYALSTENLGIYPIGRIRTPELKRGGKYSFALLHKLSKKALNFPPSFALFLAKDKPKLVHAHFGPSGYNFLMLKKMFGLPLVTSFYGYDLSLLPKKEPVWKRNYKELFRKGEIFLVEGHHMKKTLIELGCLKEKVVVQHLGVDLDLIKLMTRKLNERGEIRILISSSFREKKGIPYAIEAFGKVRQEHPELNLRLTIIGDSSGGPEEDIEKKKIFEVIRRYNLKDYIKMLGYQQYPVFLRELYQHHIFLHPSVHASNGDAEGGAPVSIIEASASGMPILSTIHCDIPEVVLNEKSGYLVSERDTDALADKLEALVLNPDLWTTMGRFGREHIGRNYDVRKQARRLEKIYDKVITERES